MKAITKLFIKFTKQYIRYDEDITSAYDINNGFCEEMATDVLNELDDYSFELSSEVFDEGWDLEQLKNYNSLPPFDKKHLNKISLPGHVWVYHDGKHYDAEAPKGVNNFWNLPIFKKEFSKLRGN